jgi:hypothetical protein
MDLFAAAGIDLGDGGRGGHPGRPVIPRSLRVRLFNHKVVAAARNRFTFAPNDRQAEAASRYLKAVTNRSFAKRKETEVRNLFVQTVLGDILGYTQVGSDPPYTLAFERRIRRGTVDVALGRFGMPDGHDEIVAPFELKGPGTSDLDAVMPGRGRSPVQQAWDYAIDAPGAGWVLVSNCVEIRLYGFGRGRDAYELFDLAKLDDPEELVRLCLILSADRLLGGATDDLLRYTDSEYRTITNDLYVDYKGLRDRLIGVLVDAANGPRLPMAAAIEPAQKLLDRILFIAFAQRTDLLPDRLLERASKARNDFVPEPRWRNFQALFRAVDEGNGQLNIWPYNGGLFAADPVADSLELPDALAEEVAKLGQWDYRSDVPVTVLGHIFEQSITDLEKLRAESRGEPAPKISKRKREGVIYTPEIVTRFLVERTIGRSLEEMFAGILAMHAVDVALPVNGDPIKWRYGERSERAFWRAYATALRDLTIVDPACGSGAFLVAAFDLLAREYRRGVERLAAMDEPVDFDPFDEIVTKNLHGVDLNSESVEITRLALWLKTARNQHRLQNLEATIKTGDSLIDDATYTDRPFDWRDAFPEVFARGGFDIVIGNPPYVRMELIKRIKPYLVKHYVVAADRTDLYAYFFERGVGLLKEGGRLGFISSSTYFRTGSGEKLRTFLGDGVAIEAVVDFGDQQIFEDVTTYPAIATMRKHGDAAEGEGEVKFLKIENEIPKDLEAAFTAAAHTMPRGRLGAGTWRFEDEPLARLRDKIAKGKQTLGEVYGAPLYGIKTGLNEAFVIDTQTRDRLVARDPNSAELLKPFLRGENIKRWRVEPEGLFLINAPKGKVKIDDYPAIRDWLLPFRPLLDRRATKQEWWELQQAQLAYQPRFSSPKIVYGHFASDRIFAFDTAGYFSNDKSYFMPDSDLNLLAILNSRVAWYFITGVSPAVRGGFHEMRVQYIEKVPVPAFRSSDKKRLDDLAETCTDAANRRLQLETNVRHRILDLAPPERRRFSSKLQNWWNLNFANFRSEVKRALRAEIPVRERDQWEAYLKENAARWRRLTAEIEVAERKIDTIVYRLFDLTADEIQLLERSLASRG